MTTMGVMRPFVLSTLDAALPAVIRLDDYPQLRQIAWHAPGADTVSPEDALGLYERNWRHVDTDHMEAAERQLLDALIRIVGKGQLLV